MSETSKIECLLCPSKCILAPYERGLCGVRVAIDGRLHSLVYGKPCAVHVDPIEKKPLFHVLPGRRILSIATVGCCLECKFCQNWQISQALPENARTWDLPPEKVVALAKLRGCQAIAYTYTEPTIFFEYMMDTAQLARKAGLLNVDVTCGYICPEPLNELCEVMDAANIDLKAFSDRFYRDICGGQLAPVLHTLTRMKEKGVWVEVTNLIIPTLNDSDRDLRELSRWIFRNLGADTPLHFSRFRPDYKLRNLPPTPERTLLRARQIAQSEGLQYVYVGNLFVATGGTTFCPKCGNAVVKRRGYSVEKMIVNAGACPKCGTKIAGRWSL